MIKVFENLLVSYMSFWSDKEISGILPIIQGFVWVVVEPVLMTIKFTIKVN